MKIFVCVAKALNLMFLIVFLLLTLVSCQKISDPADVMQGIISKAESFIKTEEESKVFSMISSDFKDQGIKILDKRSYRVIENPSLVYQEAALAKRDLINVCKRYKSDLVKRAFGIKGIMSDVAGFFVGAVLVSSSFLIVRFFYNRMNNSTNFS